MHVQDPVATAFFATAAGFIIAAALPVALVDRPLHARNDLHPHNSLYVEDARGF